MRKHIKIDVMHAAVKCFFMWMCGDDENELKFGVPVLNACYLHGLPLNMHIYLLPAISSVETLNFHVPGVPQFQLCRLQQQLSCRK